MVPAPSLTTKATVLEGWNPTALAPRPATKVSALRQAAVGPDGHHRHVAAAVVGHRDVAAAAVDRRAHRLGARPGRPGPASASSGARIDRQRDDAAWRPGRRGRRWWPAAAARAAARPATGWARPAPSCPAGSGPPPPGPARAPRPRRRAGHVDEGVWCFLGGRRCGGLCLARRPAQAESARRSAAGSTRKRPVMSGQFISEPRAMFPAAGGPATLLTQGVAYQRGDTRKTRFKAASARVDDRLGRGFLREARPAPRKRQGGFESGRLRSEHGARRWPRQRRS